LTIFDSRFVVEWRLLIGDFIGDGGRQGDSRAPAAHALASVWLERFRVTSQKFE
jgi:hypothetical protein